MSSLGRIFSQPLLLMIFPQPQLGFEIYIEKSRRSSTRFNYGFGHATGYMAEKTGGFEYISTPFK